jgi:NADPH-dependent 2,4-dienoyl-CoA reductase/sulfur reductase-like enzyme
VIIGTSAAGCFTAEALRRHGFEGEIVLAGDEPPYDRPPLSKQVLRGEWPPEHAILMPPQRQRNINALAHFDRTATKLDVENRLVYFAGGDKLSFDELVIATGARPRLLPEWEGARIHVLRTMNDAALLRSAILAHKQLLIVGAGLVGLEVAATATALGARVTVVEIQETPLAARLGSEAERRLLARHQEAGVDVRLGRKILAFQRRSGRDADTTPCAILDDDSVITAPVVVAGIGCVPNVDWLAGNGLQLSNGVVCNEYCAAAPNIWAAGDVACWFHVGLKRHVRVEHRTNASEQGMAVARNIAGIARPYAPVPYFWSDQYDIKLQVIGEIPEGEAGRVEFGDPTSNSYVRTFRRGEKLVGALAWNAAKAAVEFRRKISFEAPQP